jgi:hypothetical protein
MDFGGDDISEESHHDASLDSDKPAKPRNAKAMRRVKTLLKRNLQDSTSAGAKNISKLMSKLARTDNKDEILYFKNQLMR